MDANYNRALNLLKSNPPEGRLDIQLPRAKYLQLEKAFSKLYPESLELRYPSLSYDSFTETVTVVTCPGNIHESAALSICSKIVEYADECLSAHGEELASTIGFYGSTTTRSFRGAFEGSTKQPDGGVRYIYSGSSKVTVAVGVGFSEDYRGLCKMCGSMVTALMSLSWSVLLRNRGSRILVLSTGISEIETLDLNLSNNRHALCLYRGHKWAGELKDASIEIWRPGSSIPSKYDLIQNGHTCDSLPTTLGIKISDLFRDNAWRAANIPDKVIPFNATLYVKKLMRAMYATATDRFETFIWWWRRKRKGTGKRNVAQ
ncbi:hypothetical protein V1517DRAFT_329937 [Lipomyces orientalis]|uniref:Uncharacterized protein n=1 Tax=Lipomyces orientalis TaxID=1233043 RepID=A0ACC3THN7_9ASCO